MIIKPALVQALRHHIHTHRLGDQDLLFATREGTPISRNTFRTRIWAPAVKASGVAHHVRIHHLRHAHASWLLAGGADLKSVMERMGHTQIQTTQNTSGDESGHAASDDAGTHLGLLSPLWRRPLDYDARRTGPG
jgi:site-specific recombinase XerD